MGTFKFRAPELVLVISPSSRLKIMHLLFFFFFWISYSLRNFLTKFEVFSHPYQPVGNRLSRFIDFWLEFIMRTLSNPTEIFLVISPSSELKIMHHFFFIPYT